MKSIKDFDSIRIKLASPELIESWSYGEVKRAETINYRTFRAETDGLFCEKIFGTTKDWECYCGKFKTERYKGVICERCGVEVTSSAVRRERMGHISLAKPVSHIWFYRSTPSRISVLLGISRMDLKSVIYCEKLIVMSPGDTDLKKMQVLTEEEFNDAVSRFGETSFRAEIGAEAIRELLHELNLEEISKELRLEIKNTRKTSTSDSAKRQQILRRLEIVEDFINSGNKPEWMILTIIPVIPPDLRPMVQLDGGRFATSDLNDLYKRLINRNNRLKSQLAKQSPASVLHHELRLLQEAVDSLLDNNAQKRSMKSSGNRPLKSLSDMLKGKHGRFRQNLLGKRTDYSGRSVIVIGPELRLHQCGLPSEMALELFKPFIMRRLIKKGYTNTSKKAKILIDKRDKRVWELLDDVVKEHPVMLNRAPTLHRLSIQAFEPVLVDGKVIKLHPLVCHAFNADFDGDQMSVHVPLTSAAQIECWTMMLSSRNLLDPANGKPIVFPSQDMVLGINYLTRAEKDDGKEKKYFTNVAEIYNAIDNKVIGYNTNVIYRDPQTLEKIQTTAGRVVFNDCLPVGIPFQNACFGDKELKKLIAWTLKNTKNSLAVKLLDAIKDCGFKYATLFGATIALSDMLIPASKKDIIEDANKRESEIVSQFKRGVISKEERYNKIIDLWSQTNDHLSDKLMQELKDSQNGFNPLFLMADSGARGSKTQIRQLGGMRGLMSKPSGEIIEFPIKSNFKEGLSGIEFFISTNGARKGLADTALKTSRAGHLTRRLVDVSQDVVITEEDCGTINGMYKTALKDGDEVIESLASRIRGYYTLEDVINPVTGEVIVALNQEITDEKAQEIEDVGIEKVYVRTVLTCESKHGICKKCYGRNLANNRPVDIGEVAGIVAAQSIGQPGTQLTMRTFHVGGTASTATENNEITFTHDIIVDNIQGDIIKSSDDKEIFTRKGYIYYYRVVNEVDAKAKPLVEEGARVVKGLAIATIGKETVLANGNGFAHYIGKKFYIIMNKQRVEIKTGSVLKVKEGEYLRSGQPLVQFDPFSEPIIAEKSGKVVWKDIIRETTLIEEFIEDSGEIVKHISEKVYKDREPCVQIVDKKGKVLVSYLLPGGSILQVDDGEEVKCGDIIAKMTKAGIRTKDITGGLPRIEELVEARIPSNPAVLAQVDGVVHIEGTERSYRVIYIEDIFGNKSQKHLIPLSKHLLVRDGDKVEAAERLCDGAIDPHDILKILGERALQEFLVAQIQEVYRTQGVEIHEKHCGIIVRQMLRKVRIVKVGDTSFVQNQFVDKQKFASENQRVEEEGGVPAVAAPLLQGITRSALSNSFIAAVSFQETTKVLTNAAIAGSIDRLDGLKENVIIGHAIPGGTGMRCYSDGIKLVDKLDEDSELNDLFDYEEDDVSSSVS